MIIPNAHERAEAILRADPFRMACLQALRAQQLPQAYIGAGFLRNAIWDACHGYLTPTPLNDIDVIFYDSNDVSKETEQVICRNLQRVLPAAKWQVKNQARMHVKHGDVPYRDCEHAISHWVEIETCVAVALEQNDELLFLAPFGLAHNFNGTITPNPHREDRQVFRARVNQKQWLMMWPTLRVNW